VTSVQASLGQVPDDGGARSTKINPTVSQDHIKSYIDLGFDVAEKVFANTTLRSKVFGACSTSATIPATCIDTYLSGFATNIFRRPLTADEKTKAKAIAVGSATQQEALTNVLALHLSSPQFLIRWEMGDGAEAGSVFKLSNYEIASRISYSLTDSTPDTALLALAAAGKLSDRQILLKEATRLATSERGKYKIRQMFYGWLEFKEDFDYSNLGTAFIGGVNTSGLASASLSEVDEFLNYVIFEQKGSYKDLMTSKLSFAKHSGLAAIYGHAPVTSTPAVMTGGRQGILSRLSYLYSSTTRSNIIIRGVTFRRHVLCQNLPSPSA
ncbi:MAG: DUF1592 domain-containing protein, partial [Bdellovibrionota bacterium]